MAVPAHAAGAGEERLAREEERLARAAAAGDGAAFADLYERYESRAYNLAYRVSGSPETAADATQDAFVNVMRKLPELEHREELNFGAYLLTATRNACYDLMRKQKRTQPTDEIPENATPVGGGAMFDPGDPDDDPDRNVLVQAQQDEIRDANGRLPERQREALALVEIDELSYDEVGEIMGMKRNAVAQLVSRARIKLRDELRGTALASIAPASPECERALPLIALDDDRQLDATSDDGTWLAGHIATCNTCRLSREAMEEAGRSYRAWAPIAAAPLLFRETMAHAAEAVGADWSQVIAEREATRGAALGGAGAGGTSAASAARRLPRARALAVAAGLAAVLVLVGGLALAGDDPQPTGSERVTPAAEVTTTPLPAARAQAKAKAKKAKAEQATATAPGATPTPASGGPLPGGGGTGGGVGGNPGGGGNAEDGGDTVQPPVVGDPVLTPGDPTPPADPPPGVEEPPVTPPVTPPTQPCRRPPC